MSQSKDTSKKVIGYLSPTDPFTDRFGWSGTYFSTRKAIEDAGYKVEWIPTEKSGKGFQIKCYALKAIYHLMYGKGIFTNSNISSYLRSNYVNQKNLNKYDIIFVPGQSDVIARLTTEKPIIQYTDATVACMINYYWFKWSQRAINDANSIEQRSVNKVSLNILSSHWAAESVVKDYHASKEKVCVLPFGANIDADRVVHAPVYHDGQLKMLFSGVEWKRKGGTIAVDTAKKLIQDGYNVKLYICGIRKLDPQVRNLNFVENIGFLNKNDAAQYQKYLNIWSKVNLFILPTRAECSAIVLCEANAYGVPTITTDTGGLADYIINNVNGYRMSLAADGDAYAEKIEEWIKNGQFESLHQGAEKVYRESTSWKAWGNSFKKIVDEKIGNL